MNFNREILESICESIRQYTDNNAFYIDGQYYTYAQFAERISAIRGIICAAEVDEQIWGLAIQDNLDTYASIFALWMEGKAYVPLHPSWPADRIASIIDQIELHNILVTDDADIVYPATTRYTLHATRSTLNSPLSTLHATRSLGAWKETNEDALAYILFTSGSTGIPKGVQLTRGNIAAFMDSFWKTGITITPEDRCMQVFDLTFDVSVQSYLVALTRGACVYTVPYGQVKYLYAASLIQEQKITFGAMAPSMLTYLRPYFDEFDATSMRQCILTAEACPVDLMEAWYKCAPNVEIYDFYGPTEATIYCTYYKLTRGGNNLSLNGIISIGKPMANVQAIILDEDGNIIPEQSGAEHKGELCVAGPQVTLGYWNNPEKNASSFFTLPSKEDIEQRSKVVSDADYFGKLCYKTADPLKYNLLKENAKRMRNNPTEAEAALWNYLREEQSGAKFRRQHIIDDFIADFACLELRLIIEVDGGYHNEAEQKEADDARDRVLKYYGFKTLRFTNEEVLCNTDNVIATIKYEVDFQRHLAAANNNHLPITGETGEGAIRYYHTGDLCYWDESGNIMYSGRIDQQAKIQGFRVELGEIEYHVREYFNKEKRVMAIAFQNDKNLTEIALFIESQPLDTKPLVEYMRSKMPHYMIPTRIFFEPEFPLNKSEKVDRNALKQMI